MEPERKIKKLLRAYAKKRLADAGDPLKLHPATRRMLQAEVARNATKPDDEEASMTLWEFFRQRWVPLVGFTAVVFLVATMFMPALSASKKKAQRITAMNNLKEIGFAAQMVAADNYGRLPASLDALTNELGSDKVLTDPESGKRFIYVAGGKNLDGLSSNSLLAYSPVEKKGHAVLFADGRVEVVNGEIFSELTNHGLPEFATAKDSANRELAEAPAAVTVASGNAPATPAAAQNFQNQDSRAQNSFKNTAALNKAAAVLVNFQVQQNGNALHVVDADGSVYDGSFQPESAVAQNAPTEADRQKSSATRAEQQASQNNFFRVSGMNQTLKQNVVFTGNLLANPGALAKQQQSSKGGFGGSQSQSALTNQLPWADSRIAGTAVVSDTNSIEINAVPQSP